MDTDKFQEIVNNGFLEATMSGEEMGTATDHEEFYFFFEFKGRNYMVSITEVD